MSEITTVVLDAMGGDNAPAAMIEPSPICDDDALKNGGSFG